MVVCGNIPSLEFLRFFFFCISMKISCTISHGLPPLAINKLSMNNFILRILKWLASPAWSGRDKNETSAKECTSSGAIWKDFSLLSLLRRWYCARRVSCTKMKGGKICQPHSCPHTTASLIPNPTNHQETRRGLFDSSLFDL